MTMPAIHRTATSATPASIHTHHGAGPLSCAGTMTTITVVPTGYHAVLGAGVGSGRDLPL